MINVADLTTDVSLPGNYFAPKSYLQGDFESGLLENRQGGRLLAIPDTLLLGLYHGLNAELGSATGIILYNCGSKWGKNFFRRFREEISCYYEKPLAEMEMIELIQCLKQCWKAHGWGIIELNFDEYQQGWLQVKVTHSAFAKAIAASQQPSCHIEAGLLSAFFSELSGTELYCLQTTCESLGADSNLFILGLEKRLETAVAMVEQGNTHTAIMQSLGIGQ